METQATPEQMIGFYETSLDHHGELKITIHGNCMWPIVCDQDILTIKKIPREQIAFGDVAIFQPTPKTLHANTQFASTKKTQKLLKQRQDYFGKVSSLKRGHKTINLETRSKAQRLIETFFSPSNPYILSLPKTLWRKLKQR